MAASPGPGKQTFESKPCLVGASHGRSTPWLTSNSGLVLSGRYISGPSHTPIYHHHHHHHLPQLTQTSPVPKEMRNFPQEIVDNVIDMLAELESEDGIDEWAHHHNMSPYAMVSRGWVKRVQVHRFRQILFEGEENFSKWCRAIEPRHNTVSCYVKEICWCDMKALKNFEPHVKALTQVTHLWFTHCDFFCSLYNTNLLEAMASSLVDLEIRETNTRPEVMATFLSHLPRLRRLCVYNVAREPSSAIYVVPHPSIPFFENAGDFEHFFPSGCPSNSLGWVPSTPRFSKLAFGASYVLNYTGVVEDWISSSGESLESLYLMRDRESGGLCLHVSFRLPC